MRFSQSFPRAFRIDKPSHGRPLCPGRRFLHYSPGLIGNKKGPRRRARALSPLTLDRPPINLRHFTTPPRKAQITKRPARHRPR